MANDSDSTSILSDCETANEFGKHFIEEELSYSNTDDYDSTSTSDYDDFSSECLTDDTEDPEFDDDIGSKNEVRYSKKFI